MTLSLLPFTPKPLPPSACSIIDLAITDGPATPTESLNPFCSKLGGQAAFLHPQDAVKCPLCATLMFLVLQMDCPREEWPGVDRVAYVFGCNRRACSQQPGGWKVIFQCRLASGGSSDEVVVVESDSKPTFWDSLMTGEEVSSNTGKANTSTSASTASTGVNASASTSTATATATLSTPSTAQPCFPPIFLHIEEELIVEKKHSSSKSKVAHPDPIIPAASENDPEWSGEQYEKFRAPGTDASFTRFQKRVAHYPRQCVRYTVAAAPASSSDKLAPGQPSTALPFRDCDWEEEMGRLPCCSGCGRRMSRFELQLMPAILAFLPTESEEYLKHVKPQQRSKNPLISDGMEWGSVLVFGCEGCGPAVSVEAGVMIQLE